MVILGMVRLIELAEELLLLVLELLECWSVQYDVHGDHSIVAVSIAQQLEQRSRRHERVRQIAHFDRALARRVLDDGSR